MSQLPPILAEYEKKVNEIFIYSEDLASALIGPFANREEAQAHLKFCEERGDGARSEIISGFIARLIPDSEIGIRLTPAQDKEQVL
jgi:hypothetical protein